MIVYLIVVAFVVVVIVVLIINYLSIQVSSICYHSSIHQLFYSSLLFLMYELANCVI